MLKGKGSAFILMALDAKLLRLRTELVRLVGSMRIMAVCAIEDSLLQTMVRRFAKIGGDLCVTGKTELDLRLGKHRTLARCRMIHHLFFARVDLVTSHTSDAGLSVFAKSRMTLFTNFFMAIQTGARYLLSVQVLHAHDRTGRTAGLHVLRHVAMAILATESALPCVGVRRPLEGLNLIVVTLIAIFRRVRATLYHRLGVVRFDCRRRLPHVGVDCFRRLDC